jgi:hypothetical protein
MATLGECTCNTARTQTHVTCVPRNPRLDHVPASTYPYRRDQSHNILDVPPGLACGLDDGPDVVGPDTDRATEDGGPEPSDHAVGELPWRRGLPPSP